MNDEIFTDTCWLWHRYRWFTIEYNIINTETSEIFSEAIAVSKCGPLARIEKKSML